MDGTLDGGFAGGGKLLDESIGQVTHSAFAAAIDSDDRLVVAGESEVEVPGTSPPDQRFAFTVARYQPNGAQDATFGGGDGDLTHVFGAGDDARTPARWWSSPTGSWS